MKKSLFIVFILFFAAHFSKAQSSLFIKISSAISVQKGSPLENKLIALNVWSAENKASRNLNTEFDKVGKIYEYARLKGGPSGIVCVALSLDQDKVKVEVALQKDGITKLINFTNEDKDLVKALENKPAGYNILFDKGGNIVYENLKEGTVFSSVNQLITR
jgi:hypothetical protein